MPNLREHLLFDRIFFNREYPIVHKLLDRYAKEYGRHHRSVNHNLDGVIEVLSLTNDTSAMLSAILHILIDEVVSNESKNIGKRRLLSL